MDKITNPELYRGFRITELYIVAGIDPDDNSEGIGAFMSHGNPIPMIATDPVRLEQLKLIAQKVSNATGQKFSVVRLSVREDLQEIVPQEKGP
jgi:hypothetical protein